MPTVTHYWDHAGTLHRGPGACPDVDAMGAALTYAQALDAQRRGHDLCGWCAQQ